MKTYRGIVKGNTVILEQKPDVQEGAEAIVLVKVPEDEEQKLGSDHIPIKRELKERWGSFFIRSAESCMSGERFRPYPDEEGTERCARPWFRPYPDEEGTEK